MSTFTGEMWAGLALMVVGFLIQWLVNRYYDPLRPVSERPRRDQPMIRRVKP